MKSSRRRSTIRLTCRDLLALVLIGVAVSVATMFGGGQAQAATATSFAIIPEDSYDQAVAQLALRGFTNRTSDPFFAASDLATRAQMAVYLARALHLTGSQYGDFLDVETSDWGFGEMTAVHRAGLMDGTSLLTFSPKAPVSREDAAEALVAALRYAMDKQGAKVDDSLTPYQVTGWLAGFRDKAFINPERATSVAIAYRVGLFDIPAEGWLLPKIALTHQELVCMLQRAFVQQVSTRTGLPDPVEASAYPDLKRGSKGPLVLMIQTRLNALHYYSGEPDGKYDSHTRDAVMAFEKYERIKRTGTVGQQFWQHFFVAQAPKPVRQGSGKDRLECDLTRQVLMMIRDEKVVLVVHVSTGKYGTPTGAWHLRSKTKGWVTCSLGPIYSPCYFMPRNAIHGYPSVPTYPASHGCIRTPIWLQDVLYPYLSVGMPVDVFYNRNNKS